MHVRKQTSRANECVPVVRDREKREFLAVTLAPNKRKMHRGINRGRGWKQSEWETEGERREVGETRG